MPRLPDEDQVAEWIRLLAVWNDPGLENTERNPALRQLPQGCFRDRRDYFSEQPPSAARLVPSHVAGDQPKDRRQCAEPSARPRA